MTKEKRFIQYSHAKDDPRRTAVGYFNESFSTDFLKAMKYLDLDLEPEKDNGFVKWDEIE